MEMEEKRQVLATIERSETGYGAFIDEVPGVAVTGDTIEEIKESLALALKMQVEGMIEDGEAVPEKLRGEYELSFKMDVESFFKWMGSVVQQTGLAKLVRLNRSLVAQYASGTKYPSASQRKKLENGIHKLGEELLSIRF